MQLSHWCSATTWFLWLSLEQVNWELYCTSIGRDERVASRGQHLLVFSQSRRRSPAEIVQVMLNYVMEIEVHSNIIIKHTFHTHTKTIACFPVLRFWAQIPDAAFLCGVSLLPVSSRYTAMKNLKLPIGVNVSLSTAGLTTIIPRHRDAPMDHVSSVWGCSNNSSTVMEHCDFLGMSSVTIGKWKHFQRLTEITEI